MHPIQPARRLSQRPPLRRSLSMSYWRRDGANPTTNATGRQLPPPPVLTAAQALQAMAEHKPPSAHEWKAFFSSVLGGIVTDPALMTLPVDDHLVHRGHAVFDTANVHGGRCYGLDFHLDRLLASAAQARIKGVPNKDSLRDTILHTIAASGERDEIFVRYWLSAGRGDFAVSPSKCVGGPQFYVMVHAGGAKAKADVFERGLKEALVPADVVPHKPPFLASAKTTNYLLNALTAMAAEDQGGSLGIGVDEHGFITEQAVACVGFVGPDGVLRTPDFGSILESTTLRRVLEFVNEAQSAELADTVVRAELTQVSVAQAAEAVEVVSFGGGHVLPIVQLNVGDGMASVGDGKPGPLFHALHHLLIQDQQAAAEFLDDIPYEMYE